MYGECDVLDQPEDFDFMVVGFTSVAMSRNATHRDGNEREPQTRIT
jgi:hypothetical protein